MSSPKVIVQIAIAGAQILGKAFLAAGRQAIQNAKHRPEALSGDAEGIRGATSGSLTDRLTREHRMTLDEARLILNIREKDSIEKMLQNYEHLFKANSPPSPPAAQNGQPAAAKKTPAPTWSHYLQSKVYRARERIEAENKASAAEGGEAGSSLPKQGETASQGPGAGPQSHEGGKSS